MESKRVIKRFLFLCIVSNILTVKQTYAALKFTFTSPVHITKNFNLPQSHGQHKNVNDMKLHIKRVLNIRSENATLDSYISKVFNLHNSNPTYVFRIPDEKNRTLVFRKSDFSIPVYPNITNVNKFTKINQSLEPSSSNKHQVKLKSEEVLDELRHEKLIFQKNLDGNFEDTDYDDDMKKILEENKRSENDFVTLLNELNEDLDYEDLKVSQQHKKSSIEMKKKHGKNSESLKSKDEWSELGLDGWSGLMTAAKNDLPKKERPKLPKKISTALIPYPQNINQFLLLNTKEKTAPSKRPSLQETSSNESALDMEDLSNKLSSILLENEKILLNKTGRIPNVRWPITTTRDRHGDNDVFIARANNPFGHSTKWKYRNSTDDDASHREGRSKRGVLHLYSMIKCATGCDPLQYKGYGCYCGFLGSGRALDGIDRCCKAHDYCYSNANCFFYTEYLVPYLWKCYRGKPLCAIDNGEFGGPYSCATRLCECDRALSKCLRHYYCPRKRPVCSSNPFRLLQNLVMVF